MDSLTNNDVCGTNGNINLHMFSNILDVGSFSMQHLIDLIKQSYSGLNYFICISPYINDFKTARFDSFVNGFKHYASFKILYQDISNRYEWINDWTKLIKVFKVYI